MGIPFCLFANNFFVLKERFSFTFSIAVQDFSVVLVQTLIILVYKINTFFTTSSDDFFSYSAINMKGCCKMSSSREAIKFLLILYMVIAYSYSNKRGFLNFG